MISLARSKYALILSSLLTMWCITAIGIYPNSILAQDTKNAPAAFEVTDIQWTQTDEEFWIAIIGETPPTYTVYELLDPKRLVIEIADASLKFAVNMNLEEEGLPVSKIKGTELNDQDPAIARIELMLTGDSSYNVEHEGNNIIVVFKEEPQRAIAAKSSVEALPAPPPTPPPAVAVAPAAPSAIALKDSATVIFDVKVDNPTPRETNIYIRADGPIKNFKKAELTKAHGKPARMYIDIPNIRMPRIMKKQSVSSSVAGIRIGRRDNGIRVVFDSALDTLFGYSIITTQEGLLISIGEGKEDFPDQMITESALPVPSPATAPSAKFSQITEIPDTDTGTLTEKAEPVVVPPPAIIETPPAPVTTEIETKLAAKQKTLPPVTELIQPLILSTPAALPKPKEEITVTPPAESHKIESKKLQKEKKKPEITDEYGFAGFETQRLTVDFYKVDLHNVFRLFGEISNKNIVVDEGVSGSLTLALNDVPWDFALDIILNLKDLQKEEQFNTIVISPKSKKFVWPERASKNIAFKADETVAEEVGPISIKKRDNAPKGQIEAQKLMRQAQLKERLGDYKDALALYEEAYNKWPQNAQLAKRIASLTLVNLNMNAKGAHYAKMALKTNPSDYDAALLAAIGFANMKKVQTAKQYFDQAISSPRPSSEALNNYAAFCEEFKSYEAALRLYNKHQEIYGYTLPVMIGKARVLDKKGRTSQAIEEYKAILHSGFDLPPDLKKYIQSRVAMIK